MPVVVDLAERDAGSNPDAPAGGQGVLITRQAATRRDLGALLEDTAPDPAVATMAQSIARRLAVRRRPRETSAERGTGALASVPYAYRCDDIDLDRTIEVLAQRPVPDDTSPTHPGPPPSALPSPTDIVVRERMSSRRAVVLVVDVSGSMRGEKVRIAAATVAALTADLSGAGDQLALVAFWSDAAVVKGLTEPVAAARQLNTLLRIPARGLTNVGFGLTVAHTELARSAARRRTAILLSDAVHNAGPDPREIARRFGELHVLLETEGEHDLPLGRDLARLGHGTLRPVRTYRDVAPALNRVLGR